MSSNKLVKFIACCWLIYLNRIMIHGLANVKCTLLCFVFCGVHDISNVV